MYRWFRFAMPVAVLLGIIGSLPSLSAAQTAPDWRTIPIVDAHFHLMLFMTPEDLLERMDRHNIATVISAGAIGSPQQGDPNYRDNLAVTKLKHRFMAAAGGYELVMAERAAGPGIYASAETGGGATALVRIRELMAMQPRAFAETFPNAERSQKDSRMRRRVAVDGPVFQDLMKLSAMVKRPVLMHMEWHPESVAQLSRLLEQHPDGSVILAHCGKTSRAADIRPFLKKHANVACDLSFRSWPQEEPDYSKFPERTIFWSSGKTWKAALDAGWKALIEEMPDRFMVGIDDVHDWAQYDEVVRSIREGLLAQLSQPTMVKVANENAKRVFRLAP